MFCNTSRALRQWPPEGVRGSRRVTGPPWPAPDGIGLPSSDSATCLAPEGSFDDSADLYAAADFVGLEAQGNPQSYPISSKDKIARGHRDAQDFNLHVGIAVAICVHQDMAVAGNVNLHDDFAANSIEHAVSTRIVGQPADGT